MAASQTDREYWLNKRRQKGKRRNKPIIIIALTSLRTPEKCSKKEWKDVLRADPCAYCGAPKSGTVDHIVPRVDLEVECDWDGLTGSCKICNNKKGDVSLLKYLHDNRINYGN